MTMDRDWTAAAVLLVLMVGVGILLIWMARATASGRLKRNHIAGIRLPSTMDSDEAWSAAHVRASRPIFWAGTVSIATGVLATLPFPDPVPFLAVVIGCAGLLALMFYAWLAGRKAAAATHAQGNR